MAVAILSAAGFYVRFGRLVATAGQRRSIAIGVGVGFLVTAGQAAIKHQSAPILLMLFTDVMLGVLALSVGLGDHISRSAVSQIQGEEAPQLTGSLRGRALFQFAVVVGALVAVQFVFLVHSS
ncbi:hypothetical protein [Catenulispora sp. EB89]|uniref:hypothetical protein n=1 Tax=Catenulispora sp. EB89 TaxID=3156257 RepID=UPI0035169113